MERYTYSSKITYEDEDEQMSYMKMLQKEIISRGLPDISMEYLMNIKLWWFEERYMVFITQSNKIEFHGDPMAFPNISDISNVWYSEHMLIIQVSTGLIQYHERDRLSCFHIFIEEIEQYQNVVSILFGMNYLVMIFSNRTIKVFESFSSENIIVPTDLIIHKVFCGLYHLAIITIEGNLEIFGPNDCGQCNVLADFYVNDIVNILMGIQCIHIILNNSTLRILGFRSDDIPFETQKYTFEDLVLLK